MEYILGHQNNSFSPKASPPKNVQLGRFEKTVFSVEFWKFSGI